MNNIVGMFRKSRNVLESGGITPTVEEKIRCPICKAIDTKRSVAKNKMVCPSCGYHYRINARTRIKAICDKGSFQELEMNIQTAMPIRSNPLARHPVSWKAWYAVLLLSVVSLVLCS